MTTKYIIGIDGGSQSSKVVIFDTDGRIVCEGTQALAPMYTPRPGVAEHPGDDLYDSIVAAGHRALELFPGDLDDIVGVGLCTIRCCRALVRQDGTLAAPVQSWMDDRLSRPYEYTDDDVAFVTTTSGYLMGRITGEKTDTAANYIGPWPMDVRTWDWFSDQETFESFAVGRNMLYRLQMPGEIGGYVNDSFSASTGIPRGLPVVHTANDKATEALGSGLREETTGLVSLGTYIAGMVVGTEFIAEPQTYFTNFASEPHRYLYESAGIRRGMWTVSWLRNLVGAELAHDAAAAGVSLEDHLNTLAAAVPAGSDGLMCLLDWLAPPSQPHRKGMFIGFDERHGHAHMYRSILEGIAFRMKENIAAMEFERGIRLTSLVLSGGGSSSDACMQIFADVFDLPTVRNEVRNAAGLGAAICAAVACGIYPDLDAASASMIRHADRFEPDPDNVKLYRQLGSVYADIPAQTDAILARTHRILSDRKAEH
ncbi:FGGY-family carbohydrate kinase [Frigoribacterium sp. CG_9.8]|uniref:FGGY-family carbohydrate kinase n=1 Tax=Frigoribacterium sp. CG_9.8 TaxID=2787733 RepID=UPI0018CB5654|nr:FGGY-family carbohydrate kinase [Frigoribacterium sp. CG_9.8]MBG6108406.1 sugar (pentulose or hexulose) kinase [Frigoribacterium sp. CG_9.8]